MSVDNEVVPGNEAARRPTRGEVQESFAIAMLEIRDRAFLHDDPDAYQAGMRDAVNAIAVQLSPRHVVLPRTADGTDA